MQDVKKVGGFSAGKLKRFLAGGGSGVSTNLQASVFRFERDLRNQQLFLLNWEEGGGV